MVTVRWTDKAVMHLNSIYEYVANDSRIYAERYVKSLISSTDKLKQMPECGRKVPELGNDSFREIFFRNHRIVYRISEMGANIDILAVVHGARDFTTRLFNGE